MIVPCSQGTVAGACEFNASGSRAAGVVVESAVGAWIRAKGADANLPVVAHVDASVLLGRVKAEVDTLATPVRVLSPVNAPRGTFLQL